MKICVHECAARAGHTLQVGQLRSAIIVFVHGCARAGNDPVMLVCGECVI
jgi:hypothetical protein